MIPIKIPDYYINKDGYIIVILNGKTFQFEDLDALYDYLTSIDND